MQVEEMAAEGLRREYKITVPASEIDSEIDARIAKLSKTVKMPGFRPGKVPTKLVKRQYGRSVMGEVLEKAVEDGSKRAIADNSLRPALRPKIEVTAFDEGKDLEFKMDLELLPEVPETDVEAIELTRPVTAVTEEQINDGVTRIAESRREFKAIEETRPAGNDDQVVIDFVGTVDGETFDGGTAEGFELLLGSKRMIPGFEEGILGMSAGEERDVACTFPENYGNKELAGKAASFKVTLKEIRAAEAIEVDDEFAKSLGAEGVDDLRKRLRERMEGDCQQQSRLRAKRALLDVLAERFDFAVPAGMVDLEFDSIWKQLESEMERTGESFEQAGESEEASRAEYRAIAERRVRLGLVLSDIGTRNDIKVEPQELQAEMVNQARRYPGQEKQVFEFYRDTPGAIEQLRAPLFEDKVVDFILGKAKVTDEEVSLEELMRDPDEDAPRPGSGSGASEPASTSVQAEEIKTT